MVHGSFTTFSSMRDYLAKTVILFFCSIGGIFGLYAQQLAQLPVTIEADSLSFPEFVERINQQHRLRWYYDPQWVDTLVISAAAADQPLESLLAEVLAGTDLHVLYLAPDRIILSKGIRISQRFPGLETRAGSAPPEETVFDQTPQADNSILQNPEYKTFIIGTTGTSQQGKAAIQGFIRDQETGESLEGVTIRVVEGPQGTLSNEFGYYTLSLAPGIYRLQYQYVGKRNTIRNIDLRGPGKLDVELEEEVVSLQEVVISGEKSAVENVQTGLARLDVRELSIVPTVLGEADLLKIALTLPGVSNVGEGSSGFNVRGGATDQNLITLDDAVIYNPNHLFGFFSAFNPDVIKGASLYKSGIPAQYGGRSSSVFDVDIREGNNKAFSAGGGIGPVTGRLTLEGPLGRPSSSYILGLRSTYSDWLLDLLDDPALNNSTGSFSDVIGKVSYWLNDDHALEISGYHSRDRFRLNADTLFQYSNTSASLRWRHHYNSALYGVLSAHYSGYAYDIESKASAPNAFGLAYQVQQFNLKGDWTYQFNGNLRAMAGVSSILYHLDPGERKPLGDSSTVSALQISKEKGWENAFYLAGEWNISTRLAMTGGLRLSLFSSLGPATVYRYAPGFSKQENTVIDSSRYTGNQWIKTYGGPEPRLSLRYKLNEGLAVKVSFDVNRQYIHMLTNSVAISPTDTWRLSNTHIPPQLSQQVAAGIYQTFAQAGWDLSLEGYFKTVDQVLEYKDGAELLLNRTPETEVIPAYSRNYGVEVLIKKRAGRWNGWLSYTYSRAMVRDLGTHPEEKINQGAYFPSSFDKPHNLALVSNLKFNRRINLSVNYTFFSGRPTTLPVSRFSFNGTDYAYFSDRNRFRIPDYHRLDLALNIEGNHKVNKAIHSSWSLSIFNVLGRENAYSVFARQESGKIAVYQLSVFARPIPTLTYNFQLR